MRCCLEGCSWVIFANRKNDEGETAKNTFLSGNINKNIESILCFGLRQVHHRYMPTYRIWSRSCRLDNRCDIKNHESSVMIPLSVSWYRSLMTSNLCTRVGVAPVNRIGLTCVKRLIHTSIFNFLCLVLVNQLLNLRTFSKPHFKDPYTVKWGKNIRCFHSWNQNNGNQK